ncbi:MAG: hypothetical protein ACLQPH_04380 [Acidimicrobiales bacterium]
MAAAVVLTSGMVGVLAFSSPAAAAPTLGVLPNTGLTNGQSVTVTASGYPDSATGAVLECSNAPGQPTISVAGNAVPVSCTNPFLTLKTTTATGTLSTSFTVTTGTVGPPASGTDSAGNDAATDAALYPCPPTPTQVSAGDSCVIQFGTSDGTAATPAPISFAGGGGGGTTTTTTTGGGGGTTTTSSTSTTTTSSTSTTTTSSTSTTTTVPCNAKSTTSTGSPSLTANPGTCLNGGSQVTVTGTGFDANSPGAILECNNDAGQPTATLGAPISQAVPVSCTGVTAAGLITTTASGALSAKFTIASGTTGPPCGSTYLVTTCPTTDSSGGNPTTDAAKYPCPPTTAQLAAGDSCTLSFGDAGGKQATVAISFVPAPTPVSPAAAAAANSASTTATTTAAAATKAATTSAATTGATTGASTLAFTGAGPDTWLTLLGGLLLLDLGFLVMTLYYRPREMFVMVGRGVVLGRQRP